MRAANSRSWSLATVPRSTTTLLGVNATCTGLLFAFVQSDEANTACWKSVVTWPTGTGSGVKPRDTVYVGRMVGVDGVGVVVELRMDAAPPPPKPELEPELELKVEAVG
jgi:hypothetical protein